MPRTRGASAGGGVSPYYVRDLSTFTTVSGDGAVAKTANRVHYTPVQVPHQLTADGIIVVHGAVAAGNLYVALYDSLNYAPNNRLAVSASVAASGTNRRQYVPFTIAVQIAAGLYFTGLEPDDSLDTYLDAFDGTSAEALPAGINNGLNTYYEDLGGYLVPPLVATPIQTTLYTQTAGMFVRVSSIP